MARKRSRRVKGSGTVFYDDARGVWVGRVPVGTHTNGRTKYVERSDPDQAALVRKLAAAKPAPTGATVREWCGRWLADQQVRPATLAIRRGAIDRYVLPTLGHLKVAGLSAGQVAEAARRWAKAGLSPAVVNLQLSVLRTAMGAAVRAGLCPANPVTRETRARATPKPIDPFTRDELARIAAGASARRAAYPIALLAATGMRVGEACGLDAGDFDPAAGTVRVGHTAGEDRRRGPTKTANGVRTVRVEGPALDALRRAAGGRKAGPLFATGRGGRPGNSNVRRVWVRLCRDLGLRYRNLHQLRHSFATAALAAGYGLPDVARHLGDTPGTILKTYAHATGADLGGLLGGTRLAK